jgi:hypothetical protein
MSDNDYIRLDLPMLIVDYNFVELTSERKGWNFGENDGYTVIWLDIEKVLESQKLDHIPWPEHPSKWKNNKYEFYEGKLTWLDHLKIKLNMRPNYQPEFIVKKWMIFFGNGRHRTEFFRANGVKSMPFEVHNCIANKMKKEFG